jgi:ribosomal protein L10
VRSGGELKVYKNTLVRFAGRELGHRRSRICSVGPTAIAFCVTHCRQAGDAVGLAKVLRKYAE